MKLMLDTNTCIAMIRQKPVHILQKFSEYRVGDIGISAVSLAELRHGVATSQHQALNQAALDEFMFPLEVAAFDEQAAAAFGALRASLEKRGARAGLLDTMVAAHALSLGVTLVTDRTHEFDPVTELKVVDWTRQEQPDEVFRLREFTRREV